MQCSARKPWVLPFMLGPLDTHHLHLQPWGSTFPDGTAPPCLATNSTERICCYFLDAGHHKALAEMC